MFGSEFSAICQKHKFLSDYFQGAHSLTSIKKILNRHFILWNSADDEGDLQHTCAHPRIYW